MVFKLKHLYTMNLIQIKVLYGVVERCLLFKNISYKHENPQSHISISGINSYPTMTGDLNITTSQPHFCVYLSDQ